MARHSSLAVLAALALSAGALAQPPANTPPQPEMGPNQRMIHLPSGPQIFDSMAVAGPDSKIIRLDAPLDLIALQRNPMVKGDTREKLRPAIAEWISEVERIAIDNLDFLEEIEPPAGGPGVLDQLDSANSDAMHHVNQIMLQLGAAGNLGNALSSRNLLDRDQFTLNQHITAEYLQRCMAEVAPPNEKIADQQQSLDRTNRYNRFLFGVSSSDAMSAYHRLLAQGAPNMARIVAALNLPAPEAAKLKDKAAAAGAATDEGARRRAARAVLNDLSFPQRQAALRTARELAPPFDPFPAQGSAQLNAPAPKVGG
jgi:hypothetical protein